MGHSLSDPPQTARILLPMNRAPFSLQDTWAHVAELYGWIVSLFGEPVDIADKRVLMRKDRRDFLAWLGPVEALARRLLLLKALTLPPANTPPAPPAAQGKLVIAFTDKPEWAPGEAAEEWRVVFRVLPHHALTRPKPASIVLSDRRGGGVAYTAFPLARRLEALRRVLENPEPALKRLTRFLAARRSEIAAAFTKYRPQNSCCREALEETQEAVELALNTS